MKRISNITLLTGLFLSAFNLAIADQEIPETVCFLNNGTTKVLVDETPVSPGKSHRFPFKAPDFTIEDYEDSYTVSYAPETSAWDDDTVPVTAYLDLATIKWFAQALKKARNGFDEITIVNDTPYPIKVVLIANQQTKSPDIKARTIQPGQSDSFCLRSPNNENMEQEEGSLLMLASNKSYSICCPKRRYRAQQTSNWRTVTLHASTIAWFNNGFSVE